MGRSRVGQSRGAALTLAAAAAVLGVRFAAAGPPAASDDKGDFGVTVPVICKEIRGYEDFELLGKPELTKDQKLLIYYRPRHYKWEKKGAGYEAHFTQDGKIHRRGQKAVLWAKSNMLEYRAKADTPPELVFMRNTVALKQLKPGDYDFEIVLRDEIGKSPPAVALVPFTVVAAPPDEGK